MSSPSFGRVALHPDRAAPVAAVISADLRHRRRFGRPAPPSSCSCSCWNRCASRVAVVAVERRVDRERRAAGRPGSRDRASSGCTGCARRARRPPAAAPTAPTCATTSPLRSARARRRRHDAAGFVLERRSRVARRVDLQRRREAEHDRRQQRDSERERRRRARRDRGSGRAHAASPGSIASSSAPVHHASASPSSRAGGRRARGSRPAAAGRSRRGRRRARDGSPPPSAAPSPRASSRLATFAQAISSTRPTIAISTTIGVVNCLRRSE